MNKSILRDINDGEDCTDIIWKVMAAVAMIGAVCILLIAGWSMYRAAADNTHDQYRIQYEPDPAWTGEAKRRGLHPAAGNINNR